MVVILEGISELGARVRSNICYLICLRHLFRSRAVEIRFFSEKTYFPLCMRFELSTDISNMVRRD